MVGKQTIEEKWHQQSEEAKQQPAQLPHGRKREALARKARQLETASKINQWAFVAGAKVANVSHYRAYVIGYDGHIVSYRAFSCDSDGNATVWAKQLVDGHDVELWSGDRFVILLQSATKPGVVSYEVIDGRVIPKPAK